MFGFGMPELIIILVVALVVVGPAKLPQLGQALGSGIRNFRKASTEDPRKTPLPEEPERG
ncbi:MAG TPA: twin-arginine translocase TatA/TatE family subunit [Geobacteraceae bacterium]